MNTDDRVLAREFRPRPRVRWFACLEWPVIRVLCEANPSLGTAIVNGLLAWATLLGGVTAFCAGLPAALLALDTTPAHVRADLINRGLGVGFGAGMLLGPLTLFVFIARLVS